MTIVALGSSADPDPNNNAAPSVDNSPQIITAKTDTSSGSRRADGTLQSTMFNPRLIRSNFNDQQRGRHFQATGGNFISTSQRLAPLVQPQYGDNDDVITDDSDRNKRRDEDVIIKVLPLPIPVGTPVATPVHIGVPAIPPFVQGLRGDIPITSSNRRSADIDVDISRQDVLGGKSSLMNTTYGKDGNISEIIRQFLSNLVET